MSLCYRPSTNTSFCTESKECLEYELVCKTDEYEVSQTQTHTTRHYPSSFNSRLSITCVCRCDTTAPHAGCPLMLRPTSWGWVRPWPSGDFSSTSLGPMKEVGTGRRQKSSVPCPLSVCYCPVFAVARHPDGDDCACAGQNPRGDQDVGASNLHSQLPAAGSPSGQAPCPHQ